MPSIIDLSVEVSEATIGPPAAAVSVGVERFHRGPGFWQVSSIHAGVHTGTHIDSPRHCYEDGDTTSETTLEDLSGPVALFQLDKQPGEAVTWDDLEAADPGIAAGDVAVLATGWTDRMWGNFPAYFVDSPFLAESGANWLVTKRPTAIVFDFFEEECGKRSDFTSEEFVVHRILLGARIFLIEGATRLSELAGKDASIYAAFYKLADCDGAPARLFALVD